MLSSLILEIKSKMYDKQKKPRIHCIYKTTLQEFYGLRTLPAVLDHFEFHLVDDT